MPFISTIGSAAARAYGWLATTVSAVTSDAYFYLVSMLLSTTSTNGAQNNTFLDSSVNNFTITRNGNTTQGTFTPFSNTGWSYYFDGSGDYLTLPNNTVFNFGTGNFTLELWVYVSSFASPRTLYDTLNSGDTVGTGRFAVQITTGRVIQVFTTTGTVLTSGGAVDANSWSHIVISRVSASTRIFLNGTQVNTTYSDTNNYTVGSTNRPIIGVNGYDNSTSPMLGYISNLRVVKGSGVTSVTVPTAPLSPIANTLLLTCQSNRFVDASPNNFTITRNGDVRVTANGPFAPSSTTPTSYSGWFDGSGDYLTAPSNAAFGFGTGDLTIEGWFWFAGTISTYQRLWYFSDDNDNAEISSSTLRFGGGTQGVLITGATLTTNRWYHIAVTRASGSYRLFIDGTQSGSTASNSYNSAARSIALMATTAGANPATGSVSNFRVVKGTAVYTANFTPPTAPLTAITNTSLLTCQNTTFIDNSTNAFALTVNGNAQPIAANPFGATTTQPVSYTASPTPTSYSGIFDGTGDYLTTPSSAQLSFGTGDFTIEYWAWPNSGANNGMFQQSDTAGGLKASSANSVACNIFTTNSITVYAANTTYTTSTNKLPYAAWTHLAIVRASGVTKLYINGTLETSIGTSGSITDTTNYTGTYVAIGGYYSTAYLWNGAISNFRVVKGTAVYTSNFTPPTAPLTAITNTSLLTCQSTTFIDNSPNAFTITANGNAQTNANNPFGFTGTNVDGGAAYLDGTGDYLTVPSNAAFTFGTSNHTVEFWMYLDGAQSAFATEWKYGSGSTQQATNDYYFQAASSGGGAFSLLVGSGGAWGVNIAAGASFYTASLNNWTHVAWSRSGTTWRLFYNGRLVGSATYNANITAQAGAMVVGASSAAGADITKGYIAGLRVINGTALYTSAFVPPSEPPLPVTNTRLLMNFTNAGIYDSAQQNALETVGTVAVSTAQAKFGSVSMGFPGGSGNYITITRPSLIMPSGAGSPFTLETWVYLNSLTASTITRTDPGLALYANSSGAMLLDNTNVVNILTTANSLITTGAWYHIAITRTTGNVYTLYINGTSRATATYTSSISANSSIGLNSFNQATYNLNGYLQDFRVTNFVRYTTNFTPPTAAFPTK